jgi:serine protease Do
MTFSQARTEMAVGQPHVHGTVRSARAASSVVAALALFAMTAQAWGRTELPDFENLVEEHGPAVVSISTTRQTAALGSGPRGGPGQEQIPEFFRRFFDQQPGQQMPRPEPANAIGSGFIISEDGYILTNAHVVREAKEILVGLTDRREFPAEVIGADTKTDVALLKIDAEDLPVVSVGNSDALNVGQWVLAIGNPFGLEYTATQGIVSAVSRSLPDDTYVPFIQSDVAVNPGNSGGPLFDLEGNVIGVNSQIYSRTGGYMGLSFAIPINLAMNIADQLKDKGHVDRGWLGVAIQDMNKELAESFGMERPQGALISSVTADSPAAKAGLKPGDVIVRYNDQEVPGSSALPPLVGSTKSGSKVPVEVLRNGKEKSLTVEIGELEEQRVAAAGDWTAKPGTLGVVVGELDAEQRDALGEDRGVVIRQLDPAGPAAQAGIQPNDVILTFNHKDIESPKELADVVESAPRDKAVAVLVQRNDQTQFLTVTIPEANG